MDALEHGQRLGDDVFAPQPPVFYLLLRLISVGADSVPASRSGWSCSPSSRARRLSARPGDRRPGGRPDGPLLTVAPPFPLFAHRVLLDLPPLGIALVAFWLAWVAQERRSLGVATAGGAVLALAVAVKPNAVLALPPFLLLLLWERTGRGRMLVAALGGAGVVGLTLAFVYTATSLASSGRRRRLPPRCATPRT